MDGGGGEREPNEPREPRIVYRIFNNQTGTHDMQRPDPGNREWTAGPRGLGGDRKSVV